VRSVGVDERLVYVVVPFGSPARSRGFVVIRRSVSPIAIVRTDLLRYVDAATAAISAARLMTNDRRVLGLLSEVLQRRLTTYDDLVRAHVQGPPRNSRRASDANVEYNVWLRLSSGLVVCVDALIESSATVHETNGRRAHAREDLFEDMLTADAAPARSRGDSTSRALPPAKRGARASRRRDQTRVARAVRPR
jgi:hypothetical protein